MNTYYAYNPESTQSVSETLTISGGQIQLRNIPRQSSVTIPGFMETTALVVPAGRFRVDYVDQNGEYRECSRKIYFNSADNGKTVSVGYYAVGTPFTAADANELKTHLENTSIHGGGAGGEQQFTAEQAEKILAHLTNWNIHHYNDRAYKFYYAGSNTFFPSSTNYKNYTAFFHRTTDNTLYFYNGSRWIPCYTPPEPVYLEHVQVVHGYQPTLAAFQTTAVLPDWYWLADGNGSQIILPPEIFDDDQILGIYSAAGVDISADCSYLHCYTGYNYSIQLNASAESKCGLDRNVPNSGTAVIKYQVALT